MRERVFAAAAGPALRLCAPRCPACAGSGTAIFFELASVPVHCNILWSDVETARQAPRGEIRLAFCSECGLIFNAAFDAGLMTYDPSYENSLHYSSRFEAYAATLAQDLADRLPLRDRLVVEIGCGKGDFLRRLCRTAGARGLGIDASYDTNAITDEVNDQVTFVQEPFSSLPTSTTPALVFCRHVLEHIPDPAPFVAQMAAAARRSPGCRVFVEVPNALWTLRDLGAWDVIYEHCTYFTAPSLARVFERAGLNVDVVYSTFGDQYLCAEAVAGSPASARDHSRDLFELAGLCDRFGEEYYEKVAYWHARLSELQRRGSRVALWGAGSKGVTFVNAVPAAYAVSCLVDVNPRKQGRYVAGTGQVVVPPDDLRRIRPDVIVVMNPVYQDEIREAVERLRLECAVEPA